MKFAALLLIALATTAWPLAAEPLGTAFTYQGSLKKSGAPVSMPQDFQFGLYSSAAGTDQVGTTITLTNVAVANGLFNVNLDFGAGAFGTDQRYLQIMVRPSGQTIYTGLAPRAAIKPAPVALSVAAGGVSAAAIQEGAISTEAIQNGAITRDKLAASVNPKLLMSLFWDHYLLSPSFPPFIASDYSPDLLLLNDGVRVMTAGTYVVATRLEVSMIVQDYVSAIITLNGSTLRTLSNNTSPLPDGLTVLNSVEILNLHPGDVLSLQIGSFAPLAVLKGNNTRSTTFDIVRID